MVRLNLKGRPFSNDEYWEHLIAKNCGKGVEFKERNELILTLLTMCGLRPLEISLFTNGLLINPLGELNEFALLSPKIAYDGKERPVVFNSHVQGVIERYLNWVHKQGGTTPDISAYNGFDPVKPLLLSDHYKPYKVQSRGVKTNGSAKFIAVELNKELNKMIDRSGLSGVDRTSFIKTYCIEAFRSGFEVKDITILTSLSVNTVTNYLACDIEQYSPIVDWFTSRKEAKLRRLESFKKRRRFMI